MVDPISSPAPLDRSAPPPAGPLRLFHFPPFLRRTLANAL
jgi:hypothetical protein